MKYRIRDIINFVESSTCLTIVQAAKKLEISQPALSESIQRLERDLGFVLLYRSRSGIQLTPSGKLFLIKAQRMIQAIDELDLDTDLQAVFGGRTISIGCHPTVGQYLLPKALSYLKQQSADYRIDLRHDLSRNIQSEIQRGHIDIGVVINPSEVPDLVIQKLATDTVCVWSNRLESEIQHDTVICHQNLFQTQSILKKWSKKPKKIINTESLELITRLVGEGIGFGIIPERAVRLTGINLKKMTSMPSYKDQLSLVYRPEFGKAVCERIVIESLKKGIQ